MNKRVKILAASAVVVIGATSAGMAVANASSPDGSVSDHPDVVDAALKFTGGGQANSVERDGENGATWEVEVKTPQGEQVDVRLDQDLGLVVIETDTEKG